MSGNHGRPTAAELIDAVAGFLEGDVRANTSGAVNFHTLVAANALRIVERELLDDRDGPTYLDYPDEAALAAAIRAGDLDGRDAEVLPCLRAVVGHRLRIAHPGYTGPLPVITMTGSSEPIDGVGPTDRPAQGGRR